LVNRSLVTPQFAVQVQAVLSPQRGAIIFDRQFDPFILAAVSEIDTAAQTPAAAAHIASLNNHSAV